MLALQQYFAPFNAICTNFICYRIDSLMFAENGLNLCSVRRYLQNIVSFVKTARLNKHPHRGDVGGVGGRRRLGWKVILSFLFH